MSQNEIPLPSLFEIRALECQVWQALVAGDADADGAMLTDDFLGVYPNGFSDRVGHMSQLSDGPTMAEYHLSAERLLPLGAGQVMFCYRAEYRKPDRADWQAMFISSVWRHTTQGWRNSFSQDTPAA